MEIIPMDAIAVVTIGSIVVFFLATVKAAQSLSIIKRVFFYTGLIALLFLNPIIIWTVFYHTIDFSKTPDYSETFYQENVYDFMTKKKTYFGDSSVQELTVNSDGLVADREYKPGRNRDKTRIALLGDSFIAGFGLAFKETLGYNLEKIYSEKSHHESVETINFALFGANTDMGVKNFIHKGAKYEPDLIIIRFFDNDIYPTEERLYSNTNYAIFNKTAFLWPKKTKLFFIRNGVYRIRSKFEKYYLSNKQATINKNVIQHLKYLDAYADKNGINVILINDVCDNIFKEVCNSVQNAAIGMGWYHFDIKNYKNIDFSNPEMWLPNDYHPSAYANQILAEELYNYLIMNNLLSSGDSQIRKTGETGE